MKSAHLGQLQIIVAANGTAGVNFEHSGVDGHTVLRFVADVYTELILRFAKTINSASSTLFKAKLSPWAVGGPKKAPGGSKESEEPEEIDTVGAFRGCSSPGFADSGGS